MTNESCGLVRSVLWPEAGPRSMDEEIEAARAHVQGCVDCRAFLEEMRALQDAVRHSARHEVAPVELREAVYARLAEARRGRGPRSSRLPLAGAAILALLLVGAVAVLRLRSPLDSLVSAIAAEHATAVGGDRLATADPAEIERWLIARVGFAVHVPAFTGFRVTGARVCLTEEGRGAVVEYADGERVLSYFILLAPPDAPVLGTGIHRAAESGYRMALWREGDLLHVLVGTLSHEQLDLLAKECIEQMMRLARAALGPFTTLPKEA